MAEVMGNSEYLMGSTDLQSDRKQGGLIPTLLMEDSRTQLIHLARHSALDETGQARCGRERGPNPAAPQLLWQPGACRCPQCLWLSHPNVPVCREPQCGTLKSSWMLTGSVSRHWGTRVWPQQPGSSCDLFLQFEAAEKSFSADPKQSPFFLVTRVWCLVQKMFAVMFS